MRRISLVVIHCSDSDMKSHDDPAIIKEWHLSRGWDDVGYHFIITKDGRIHNGRPVLVPGAHVKGHNKESIGICLTGSVVFSEQQLRSCRHLVRDLLNEFGLEPMHVLGHNELDKKGKTCPNFDIYKDVMHLV